MEIFSYTGIIIVLIVLIIVFVIIKPGMSKPVVIDSTISKFENSEIQLIKNN